MNNKVVVKNSTSLVCPLTLLFVALKLTGNIDWSWWWVLSPMWLPFILGVAVFGIIYVGIMIFAVIITLIEHYNDKKSKR